MEEMEISPRFLSPISEATPWPVQQRPYITEGIPQVFPKQSPELTPTPKKKKTPVKKSSKAPVKKVEKSKAIETEFIFSPISEHERKPFQKILSPKPVALPKPVVLPKKKQPPPKPSAPPKSISPPKPQAVAPKRKVLKKREPQPPKKEPLLLKEMTLEEFLVAHGVTLPWEKIKTARRNKQPLGPVLARESFVCSMIKNNKISFGRYIKEGVQGRINEMAFANQKGRYVIKTDLKPIQPNCIENKKLIWPRTDGKGESVFSSKSLLCTPSASEFLISLIMGGLKKEGSSQNFMDTVYMASCYSNGKIENQYTLMEQVAGDIHKLFDMNVKGNINLTKYDVDSLYIQILHALHMCQKLRIVHGDLHQGNVLYENAATVSPELNNTKYFSYEVNGKYLRFPAAPYIMKIGDWGFAIKYSKPEIGNFNVAQGGYNMIPNFYSRSYDVAFITLIIYNWFPQNELLKRVMAWMMNCRKDDIPTVKMNYYDLNGAKPSSRPLPWTWASPYGFLHVTPDAILTNPDLMELYLVDQNPADAIRLDRPII